MFQLDITDKTGDRSMTRRFTILNDEYVHPTNYDDESDYRPALEVVTFHDKDRKRLITSIKRVTANDRMVRWTMELSGEDKCPVSDYIGVPVARYSAKGLIQRHAEVLDQIKDLDESTRAELFAWATRAKHL